MEEDVIGIDPKTAKRRSYYKSWCVRHPDYFSEYYNTNRARMRAIARKCYLRNREEILEKRRTSYAKSRSSAVEAGQLQ